eukprot:4904767-Pleurochrysis_carterae.AAC.1
MDPRKGPMHIRHRSIERSVIKLYGVQTFTDKVAADGVEGAKTAVRITRRSLQQLAVVCPHILICLRQSRRHIQMQRSSQAGDQVDVGWLRHAGGGAVRAGSR